MARRIVLDTNVLVSGLIVANGPSGRILDAILTGELTLIASAHLLQEFGEVTVRPHIVRKYPKVTENAETVIDYLRTHATIVQGTPAAQFVVDDPDDDFVVACAIEGNAEYIVSGDEHLLALRQHGPIRIVNPAQYVALAFLTDEPADE